MITIKDLIAFVGVMSPKIREPVPDANVLVSQAFSTDQQMFPLRSTHA